MLVKNLAISISTLEKAAYSSLLFLVVSGNGVVANSMRQLKEEPNWETERQKNIGLLVVGVIGIVAGIVLGIYFFKDEIKACIAQRRKGENAPLLGNEHEAEKPVQEATLSGDLAA